MEDCPKCGASKVLAEKINAKVTRTTCVECGNVRLTNVNGTAMLTGEAENPPRGQFLVEG